MLRAAVLLVAVLVAAVAAAKQPNIILILSDDMGYSDLGCYGGEINTPTLDALAAGGLQFTQFYNTARCCPTRASLLTGLYPHQAGVGHMMADSGLDGYRGELNRTSATIAEVLRPAGYRTYMVGKWHVTKATQPDGNKENWPLQRGFDRYYGTITGAGSFWDPATLTRDNTTTSAFADPEYKPATFYYTDALADHAVRFVREHGESHAAQPFFMYLAFTAAHWPMHAPDDEISKYRGKYDAGYDAIRKARLAKMKQLGLLDDRWDASPTVGEWDEVEHKEWEARCMETYAAMVTRMDAGIGRLVEELKRQNKLNDTLICFLQDNGGCAEENGRNQPKGPTARADAPTLPPMTAEQFQTAITPKQSRDGFPVRQGVGVMPGPADTYIAYGRNWANVSNTPFREYKHWVHEGGISTPLIVHWPAGFARRGEFEKTPGHLIDLMATCVDVADATYPKQLGEHAITPLEGRSLAPAFAGKPIDREAIYWEHEGNRAIRIADWKLVAKGPRGAWELYDLKSDRTEQHDLAASQPDRASSMADQWEAWAKRAKAIPWIWGEPYGEAKTKPPAKRKK
jgi:arylsulfatase